MSQKRDDAMDLLAECGSIYPQFVQKYVGCKYLEADYLSKIKDYGFHHYRPTTTELNFVGRMVDFRVKETAKGVFIGTAAAIFLWMSPVLKNRPVIMKKVIAASIVLTGDMVFALGGMANSLDQWTRADAPATATTATTAATTATTVTTARTATTATSLSAAVAAASETSNPFESIDTNDMESKALQQYDHRTQDGDDNASPHSIIAEFIRRDFALHNVPLSDGARPLLSDKALRELYERQCLSTGVDPDAPPPDDSAMGDGSNSGWKEQ